MKNNNPKCPKCSGDTVKSGFNKQKRQKYTCKVCGYRGSFTGDKGGRPPTTAPCKNCGKPKVHAKGLCDRCYYFLIRKPKLKK